MANAYVHGYDEIENQRLLDQSHILDDLIHRDTLFEPGSRVLEVGCGIGAQTRFVAPKNPNVHFTCVDINEASIEVAKANAARAGLRNVTFIAGNVFTLQEPEQLYDAALFCFVLEHLPRPERAVERVMKLVRPGGTLMAIEGDHGSTFFHPHSEVAWRTIQCLIDLQRRCGGDALIGRRLYALFSGLGVTEVHVDPRVVYSDPSRPEWVLGFTKRTYIAMVEGVREQALASGMVSADEWDAGIVALRKSIQGSFSYTFFKAIGKMPTSCRV